MGKYITIGNGIYKVFKPQIKTNEWIMIDENNWPILKNIYANSIKFHLDVNVKSPAFRLQPFEYQIKIMLKTPNLIELQTYKVDLCINKENRIYFDEVTIPRWNGKFEFKIEAIDFLKGIYHERFSFEDLLNAQFTLVGYESY
jgi:uncharacterized protein YjbK